MTVLFQCRGGEGEGAGRVEFRILECGLFGGAALAVTWLLLFQSFHLTFRAFNTEQTPSTRELGCRVEVREGRLVSWCGAPVGD